MCKVIFILIELCEHLVEHVVRCQNPLSRSLQMVTWMVAKMFASFACHCSDSLNSIFNTET